MSGSDENVVFFTGDTKEPFTPEILLRGAIKADLADVIVIGWDKDEMLFVSSSLQKGPDMLWLLEKAKMTLVGYNGDD